MTRDDIITMAGQVDPITKMLLDKGHAQGMEHETFVWFLERFAALVAAAERDKWEAKFKQLEALVQVREQQPNKPCCLAEREACAKVCEYYFSHGARDIADAIRARGQ